MDIATLSNMISKILQASPVEILDDETNTVLSTEAWELVSPRTRGDYKGSRTIGSANMVTAYNIVYTKMLSSSSDEVAMKVFHQVIDALIAERIIRKKPEIIRQTFKVI